MFLDYLFSLDIDPVQAHAEVHQPAQLVADGLQCPPPTAQRLPRLQDLLRQSDQAEGRDAVDDEKG